MKPVAKVIPYRPGDISNGPMLPNDVCVEFYWEGVDRPCSYGIVCLKKHAPRLIAACDAGVLFTDPKVATDVHGKTYIDATCQVLGKTINADLKRLGY